jgi:hypothetical protein
VALLEMQADPEEYEGPQQHGEDCRGDRLQGVEMLEVMVPSRNNQADDDVNDEQQGTKPAAHARPLPLVFRSSDRRRSATPHEVHDRQHDKDDHDDANDSDPTHSR